MQKMQKRLKQMSVLGIFVLFFAGLILAMVTFSAPEKIQARAEVSYLPGNTFIVKSAADLQNIANPAYTGTKYDTSNGSESSGKYTNNGYYFLGTDITITSSYLPYTYYVSNEDTVYKLAGTLDGKHPDGTQYKILYSGTQAFGVNFRDGTTAPKRGLGIIGAAGGATIQNIIAEGIKIDHTGVSTSSTYLYIEHTAVLVGFGIDTRFINCHVSNADVTGRSNVGGIVGTLFCSIGGESSIENCSFSGSLKGSSQIGGIVARAYDVNYIRNCYSTGTFGGMSESGPTANSILFGNNSLSAGVVGYAYISDDGRANSDMVIEDCYADGVIINGAQRGGGFIGGAGRATSQNNNSYVVKIRNCYAFSTINDHSKSSSNDYHGGFIGVALHTVIDNCYSVSEIIKRNPIVESGGNSYSHYYGGIMGGSLSKSTQNTSIQINNFVSFLSLPEVNEPARSYELPSDRFGYALGFMAEEGTFNVNGFYHIPVDGRSAYKQGTNETFTITGEQSIPQEQLNVKAKYTELGFDFTNTWGMDLSGTINNGYPFLRAFSDEPEPQSYTVTVTNGTGGREYAGGETAQVTAESPALGYEFKEWQAEGAFVSSDDPYSFTVTGDITLTAVYQPIAYAITYENAGTHTNPATYNIEELPLTLSDASAPSSALEFRGWKLDGEYVNAIPVGTTGPVTLTADYYDLYIVTLSGGTIGGQQSVSVREGAEVKAIADTAAEGKVFKGWYDGSTRVSIESEYTFTVESDISLTAEFMNLYTIQYEMNGGNNHASNLETYTEETPLTLLETPAKDGFKFAGWYRGGEAVTHIDPDWASNVTLTAEWKELFDISVIKGTGAGEYAEGDTATVTADVPDAGYEFKEWQQNGAFVSDESTYSFTVSGDLELTAVYKTIAYKISYNLDGGENNNDNPDEYTVESGQIELKAPAKNGFKFAGWYRGGEAVTKIDPEWMSDITLTAEWKELFDISVIKGTGAGEYAEGDTATVTAEGSAAGYEFKEWQQNGAFVSDESTYSFTVSGDLELTAVYKTIAYKISYNLDGGENNNDNPGEYTVESGAITLEDAFKKGYNFTGWYDEDGNKVTTIAKGSTGNIDLIARFEEARNSGMPLWAILLIALGGAAIIISAVTLLIVNKKRRGKYKK